MVQGGPERWSERGGCDLLVGREYGKVRLSACSRGLLNENLFQERVCCVLIEKSLTMSHDLKKRA